MGVILTPADIRGRQDIGPAFQAFVKQDATLAIVLGTPMLIAMRRQIAAFALALRVPTVFAYRE
jgi:hypothetical protein